MHANEFTVVIPARNAASTIARAVASALAQPACRVVLVEHASSDGTAEIARGLGRERLTVVTVPANAALGAVRQAGLAAVETAYGVWLDADDEFVDGRGQRLVDLLDESCGDLAFDEIDLHDGVSGAFVRRIAMPPFLRGSRDVVRCFERNFLPGVGVPAFRTSFARAVGYDAALHGAEDYDFLLRAVAARATICLVREPLYRQFAYETSLSRDLDNQRTMCARALGKHEPRAVEKLLDGAGLAGAEKEWVMVSFFVFRGDFEEALTRLEQLRPEMLADARSSTWDRWRLEFETGTLLLALGRSDDALAWLHRAERTQPSAEGANNLGVALALQGDHGAAARCFAAALQMFPTYRDAAMNRAGRRPPAITLLPLRSEPARSDYNA